MIQKIKTQNRKLLKKITYRPIKNTKKLKREIIVKVDDYLRHILSNIEKYETKLKNKIRKKCKR
jgi:hypothetical protein